ncbi:HNH endonuclease [Micromonospora sediminicola]|uniref:HNH endonuclease n=1 Tax=Micromonospora sediminicola TaxID=946078 RepID=UPI0037A47EBC
MRAVPHERFADQEIFERDGWICQIGKHPVDPDAKYPDPACATIDHILPRSYLGWSHTRANVRLACLDCNNRRQNKVSDEDLRVLGMRREDLRLAHVSHRPRSLRTGRFERASRDEDAEG